MSALMNMGFIQFLRQRGVMLPEVPEDESPGYRHGPQIRRLEDLEILKFNSDWRQPFGVGELCAFAGNYLELSGCKIGQLLVNRDPAEGFVYTCVVTGKSEEGLVIEIQIDWSEAVFQFAKQISGEAKGSAERTPAFSWTSDA